MYKMTPGETTSLNADPAHADILTALDNQLRAFFDTYADERANLWKGGVPIQNSERKSLWSDACGADWQPVYAYQND